MEARPVFYGDELKGMKSEDRNRAKDIIKDFMIAANGVTARYLEARIGEPSSTLSSPAPGPRAPGCALRTLQ